ncbi:MAG: sigma-70 family RNA polymerase sigma factor [Polyangia bacterium]
MLPLGVRSDKSMPVLSFVLTFVAARFSAQAGGGGEPDEGALLARIARGDREAYRTLYERLSAQGLGLALRVLGSRAEAEEALQESFLDVWTRSGQFDAARGNGRSWVLSMIRNRSIDRVRTRGAVARMVDRAESDAATLPRHGETPADALVRSEARAQIQSAMAELTEEQRHALELAYFEGLSQSEIAERLGEPLGTVKSRVRAAMDKLGRLIPKDRGRA